MDKRPLPLRQVLPALPFHNAPNSGHCDCGVTACDMGNAFSSSGAFPNLNHIGFDQSSQMAIRAGFGIVDSPRSTSRHAIRDIVRAGPRKQMARVDARRVVTSVANNKPANVSAVYLVGNTMSQQGFVVVGNNTVSLGIQRPFPLPAGGGITCADLRPKIAGYAAKWLDFALFLKRCAAHFTGLWIGLCHDINNTTLGHRSKGFSA